MLTHTHKMLCTMLFKTYFGGSFRNTGFRINNPVICMWVMCVGRVKPTEKSERYTVYRYIKKERERMN